MLTSSTEFVENSEYAFGVARIRALETRFIDDMSLNALLASDEERFAALFLETTGMRSGVPMDTARIIDELEESFSETFRLVQSLLLEEEIRRLIFLPYDYELVKLIIKEEKGEVVSIPVSLIERSRFGYGLLKSLLGEGKVLETGETMQRTFRNLMDMKEVSSRDIDVTCDRAYYDEVFQIFELYDNPFIRDYFIREVDVINIVTVLRMKIQGKRRADIRTRYLPHGSIGLVYLEEGFDLNLEGFAGRIQFSPFSKLLYQAGASGPSSEEEKVAQIERLLDGAQARYLRESVLVTFGVEPILAYLWARERELKNLRTILIAKTGGMSTDEIKKHLRGFHG
jgi:V/A-type H+-transporting ATPase subunit C